ncbi:carboxypeptidase O-like [Ambystoma mexicanum]|uniref:carboxypeptidase O-like n=1 Tax=Ambystoma mexicanum TaxID=8296 RepID=UPI0037E83DA4
MKTSAVQTPTGHPKSLKKECCNRSHPGQALQVIFHQRTQKQAQHSFPWNETAENANAGDLWHNLKIQGSAQNGNGCSEVVQERIGQTCGFRVSWQLYFASELRSHLQQQLRGDTGLLVSWEVNEEKAVVQWWSTIETPSGSVALNDAAVNQHTFGAETKYEVSGNNASGGKIRDQVFKVIPKTSEHVEHLQTLCNIWLLDLWKPSQVENIHPGAEVHIRVPGSFLQQLKESLIQHSISFEILITNVGELINYSSDKHQRKIKSLTDYNYTKYHRMDEIYDWMDQIVEKYSDVVTLHSLGATYESRAILYLKIGAPSSKPKKMIWMDCGIHAREWIAPAYCQWFVKEMLQNKESDPKIQKILQAIDIYIVPVLNIDGYIYSWTTDRLWRKSRSPHENGTCYGVDLNRNFNAKWCSIGASHNCREEIFCGTGPASEPETKAVARLVETKKSDILCYLTIHSYGQLILQAYGYTKEPSKNHHQMLNVSQGAAAAILAKHGKEYRTGSASVILYSNSGSSRDWATDLGIPFSYTFELRDKGTFGFLLPEEQIQATCEETMAGMMTIISHVSAPYIENSAVALRSASLWGNIFIACVLSSSYTLWH